MKTHRCIRNAIVSLLGWFFSTVIFAATAANTSPISTVQLPVLKSNSTPSATKQATIIPTPPTINAKGYILVDADSGYIIAEKNMHERMPPASLTKLMTMYVVSEALKSNRIHLTDQVLISENAWKTGGSRMFIQVGTQVPVQDLINGIVVASGNDACVAMSEFIAGSQPSFVDLMNKTAAEIGLKNTHYTDATGLPNPENYTSPFDLSLLTRAIIRNYPVDYKVYSQKWMTYNNIKQPNRNLLLWRDPSVDGLKTGFTDDAGYCLAASAKRQNMRLIAIVMGSTSPQQRANDAQALLTYGFRFYETHKLYAGNVPLITLRTWFGKHKETTLGLAQDLYVTIPVGQHDNLNATISSQPKVKAPIAKGKDYGTVRVTLNNQAISSQSLVALIDNPVGGIFARLRDHIALFFSRWF